MKCFVCGTGNLVRAKSTVEFYRGKIVVREVLCKKCDNCGEEFFSEQTRKRVSKRVDEAKKALNASAIVKSVSV